MTTEKKYTQAEVDEIVKKEIDKLRNDTVWLIAEKATEIAEKKAKTMALTLANEYKELSPEMRKFEEEKARIKYFIQGWALPNDMNEQKMMMMQEFWKPLGLNLMQCINWMAFINWKPAIYWATYLSVLSKSWYKIKFLEKTPEKVSIELEWPNWKMTWTYTKQMAETAGQWKNIFIKYPVRMLTYKAVREAQMFLCPEIFDGVNLVEEEKEIILNSKDATTKTDEEKEEELRKKQEELKQKYNNL